jgi:hypothetical protein
LSITATIGALRAPDSAEQGEIGECHAEVRTSALGLDCDWESLERQAVNATVSERHLV